MSVLWLAPIFIFHCWQSFQQVVRSSQLGLLPFSRSDLTVVSAHFWEPRPFYQHFASQQGRFRPKLSSFQLKLHDSPMLYPSCSFLSESLIPERELRLIGWLLMSRHQSRRVVFRSTLARAQVPFSVYRFKQRQPPSRPSMILASFGPL
jgi:hypothetical protein